MDTTFEVHFDFGNTLYIDNSLNKNRVAVYRLSKRFGKLRAKLIEFNGFDNVNVNALNDLVHQSIWKLEKLGA